MVRRHKFWWFVVTDLSLNIDIQCIVCPPIQPNLHRIQTLCKFIIFRNLCFNCACVSAVVFIFETMCFGWMRSKRVMWLHNPNWFPHSYPVVYPVLYLIRIFCARWVIQMGNTQNHFYVVYCNSYRRMMCVKGCTTNFLHLSKFTSLLLHPYEFTLSGAWNNHILICWETTDFYPTQNWFKSDHKKPQLSFIVRNVGSSFFKLDLYLGTTCLSILATAPTVLNNIF